jgi:hypothetical protein
MKYILITKDIASQKSINEKTYSSIRQIAKELQATYCSCYENYLMSEEPERPLPKKRSQLKFNSQYKIISQ